MPSSWIPSTFKVAIKKATMTTNGNHTDISVQTNGNSRAWVLILKARKMFLFLDHQTKLGPRKSKQSLNFSIGPHQVIFPSHSCHAIMRKFLSEGRYFFFQTCSSPQGRIQTELPAFYDSVRFNVFIII